LEPVPEVCGERLTDPIVTASSLIVGGRVVQLNSGSDHRAQSVVDHSARLVADFFGGPKQRDGRPFPAPNNDAAWLCRVSTAQGRRSCC
jgi:hypothetical protein